MEEAILLKVRDAAKIVNISATQAYRLVPEWKKLGIVVEIGPRSVRVNRKGLLAWAGESRAA